jgi:uncharacterized protein YciI
VLPHVDYHKGLIEQGTLRASGPVVGSNLRAGLLLFTVENRAELGALIAADPLAIEGLIKELAATEWKALFGTFAGEAALYSP